MYKPKYICVHYHFCLSVRITNVHMNKSFNFSTHVCLFFACHDFQSLRMQTNSALHKNVRVHYTTHMAVCPSLHWDFSPFNMPVPYFVPSKHVCMRKQDYYCSHSPKKVFSQWCLTWRRLLKAIYNTSIDQTWTKILPSFI